MKLRKVSVVAAAVVFALAGAACADEGEDSAAQEQSFEVQAFDYYFEPTSLQFEPGANVTLTLENGGSVAHSITIPDLDFEAEAQSGDSIDNSFTAPTEPGSLDFYCKFHPDEMEGTISIGGADQPIEEDVDTNDDDPDVEVEVEDETEDDAGTTTEEEY